MLYFLFFNIIISHILLINFNDNVDNVKPITGTKELNAILLVRLIRYE